MAGRGWAWTAYDWDEGRLFNYIGDAQNTFPIWNATPLVALDVYEHAYFLDYQTDRASYIDAFFDNLDWDVVNDWVARLPDPAVVTIRDHRALRRSPATWSAACPCGLLARAGRSGATTSARSAAATSARRTSGASTAASSALPVIAARHREGVRARVRSRRVYVGHARRRARRRRGDARALAAALPRLRSAAGRWSRPAAARSSASRRSSAAIGAAVWIVVFLALRATLGRVDRRGALAAGRRGRCSASPGR